MSADKLNYVENPDVLNELFEDAEVLLKARFGEEYAQKPELVLKMADIILNCGDVEFEDEPPLKEL